MKIQPHNIILVGLGFGDECKGATTDYFCRTENMSLVVRYNGASNAGHNVVTPDGKHHCFSQFGSGTFAGAATLLSRYCFVDPFALAREASVLADMLGFPVWHQLFIDYRTPVITLFHTAANRIREFMRGTSCHGSTGKGIGELAQDVHENTGDVVLAGDLNNRVTLAERLKSIQERKRDGLVLKEEDLPQHLHSWAKLLREPDEPRKMAASYADLGTMLSVVGEAFVHELVRKSRVVYEGAQGVLLDEWHGFHPYTTWSNTTTDNALRIIAEAGDDVSLEIHGILRSYHTRHGAGPFPSVIDGCNRMFPGEHNVDNKWQQAFKVGRFDKVLAKYAADAVNSRLPMTGICLTHMDVIEKAPMKIVESYRFPADECMTVLPFNREHNNQKLARQQALGEKLMYASPVLSDEAPGPEELIALVEKVCRTPVRITSRGPSAGDRARRLAKVTV